METKKIFALLIAAFVILLFAGKAEAQTLYFCEGVDDNGYPITESSVFNISSSGGYLYTLVRLPYAIECRSVRIEIYRNGNYDNTVYIDTEKSWTWFWKKITFYKAGNYSFDVYDCFDYRLTSGSVKIQIK
jgi:hypothetical protein